MQQNNYDRFLKEQIDYYQARAGEYDEGFLCRGRYDRGFENNQLWFNEGDISRDSCSGIDE